MEQILKLNKKIGDMSMLSTEHKETIVGAINEIQTPKAILIKRGLKKDLPENALSGEPFYCTDTNELYMGMGDNLPLSKVVDKELTEKFHSLTIDSGNSNAEIVTSRVSTHNNTTYNTLGDRLNSIDLNIDSKVTKVSGKGLSSNDFTNEDKNKMLVVDSFIEKVDKVSTDLIENTKEINDAKGTSENLKQELDNRFNSVNDNLKAQWLEQSGSSIKVLNSLNGTTRDLQIEGNTLQNLAPFESKTVDRKKTGEYQSIEFKNTTTIKPNTKYTIIYTISKNTLNNLDTVNNRVLLFFVDNGSLGSTQIVVPKNTGKFVGTLTTKSQFDNFRIGVETNVDIGEITFDDFMILEGDHTANPPTSYFEGIKSVGEEDGNKVSISSHNTGNMLKITKLQQGGITWVAGDNYDANKDTHSRTDFIEVFPNLTVYALKSSALFQYDKSKKYLGRFSNDYNLHVKPEVLKDNCAYIRFSFDRNIQTVDLNSYIGFDPNKLNNEPYKSDKKDISLPYSNGLKGLGTAKDIKIGNKIVQKIGREVININRDGITQNVNDETWISGYFSDRKLTEVSTTICDKLPVKVWGDVATTQKRAECIWVNGEYSWGFMMKKTTAGDTVQKLADYISSLNATMYYKLTAPIEYQLVEGDMQLATYKDVTYISSENSIESTNYCKVAVDRDAVITRLVEESKILDNESNELKEIQKNLASVLLTVVEPSNIPVENEEVKKDIIIKLKEIVGEN